MQCFVSHISLAGDDPAVGERRLIVDAVTQLSQVVGVSACPEAQEVPSDLQ
jgi:hypothetical protein